jgi:hypothetical protein
MRRSRVDRREKPLDAGQGHDSAEVSARLERCVGLELTEEKNRLMQRCFLTRGGEPLQVNSEGEARCRFVPTHSGFFLIKQVANETQKHVKDGRKHLSSVFLFTFSTYNILRKNNMTLQGKKQCSYNTHCLER